MPDTPHRADDDRRWRRAQLMAAIAAPAQGGPAQAQLLDQAEQMADKILERNGLA